MGLQIITPPKAEPISVSEARQHLRQDDTPDDVLIASMISASRANVEAFLRRPLLTTKYRLTLDTFPGTILPSFIRVEFVALTIDVKDLTMRLPIGGVQSVESIKYIDTSGAQQTLDTSAYVVDASEQPCRIAPAYQKTWPPVLPQIASVKIEFTAGYGDAPSAVPPDIIAALKLVLGHLYENRENTVMQYPITELPMGAESFLWPHRVFDIRKG